MGIEGKPMVLTVSSLQLSLPDRVPR